MKPKQIISIVLFAIAVALLIWWFANGHHPWTTTQSMIEVKTTDELFGTTVTTQKWVDDFQASGLLNVVYSVNGFQGRWVSAISFYRSRRLGFLIHSGRKKAKQ